MKQLIPKIIFSLFIFTILSASIGVVLGGTSVFAATSVEKKAADYCAKIKGPTNDPSIAALRTACIKGYTEGYNGGTKATTCEAGATKTTCDKAFDAGKTAQQKAEGVAGSVEGAASPCADPKAIDPECVRTGRINLTNEDAKRAGLEPKSATDIVGTTLNGVYTIVAIIAVIVIVLAGIRMITADGDATKFAAARQTIIYAVIGLAVVGSAFIITGVIQGIGTK